jgi:hypothetical protein
MEFFTEFSWAVPNIFSGAIAKCKFEEGDIIYDSQFAYQEWERAIESIKYCIKVKSPRRTLRITKGKSVSAASANWYSEVVIDFKKIFDEAPSQLIKTTQGRLFSLLWKGDLEILNKDKLDPLPPLFLKDLRKRLTETVSECESIAGNKTYFIMAYDPTNDVSLRHHLGTLSALRKHFGCELSQLTPKDSGFKEWEKISPVICTNLYVLNKGGYDEVFKTLKQVLYKPSRGAKKDMFRLSAHGILGPV